jgi:hypothetical protein
MATNFPSSADSFTNPTSGDTLDNPPHDQQHSDINDAMEAVQGALLDGAPLHVDDANERVGVGTASPEVPLHVEGGTDAALTAGSGYLQVGETTGDNIVIDGNEILARNNGSKDTLFMQNEGDYVYIGSNVTGTRSTESLRIQSGIRGQLPSTNGSNQLIHLYNNVNIGFPTGWGGQDAPQYGLHVYGAITTSTHPMFVARSDVNNQEPTSTTQINYAATTANRGNHYNTSTSTFTAPLDGVYEFNLRWWFKQSTTGTAYVYLYVNGAVYGEYRKSRPTAMTDYEQCYVSWKVALSANDAVHIRANGTSNGTFHSSSTNRYSEFSGMLLG